MRADIGLTNKNIKRLKDSSVDPKATSRPKCIIMEVDTSFYKGEILIFSGKNEYIMGEMFDNYDIKRISGNTCPKCGSGLREDNSCDCKESMQ